MKDEFRVEVNLDDEEHGYSLGEKLRALDLDDEARERLGEQVAVTRDGPYVFLYTETRGACAEAERVVKDLLEADRLTATVKSVRWHPIAESWRDADEPLPTTEEERREEIHSRAISEALDPDESLPSPGFVFVGRYKPEFLRDLGL